MKIPRTITRLRMPPMLQRYVSVVGTFPMVLSAGQLLVYVKSSFGLLVEAAQAVQKKNREIWSRSSSVGTVLGRKPRFWRPSLKILVQWLRTASRPATCAGVSVSVPVVGS
ncbi:MAG: hypothetical protein PHS17_13050 [Desulfobacterales bacterium]|nr:hypothetical protein [Desulfobacterales bacterium]